MAQSKPQQLLTELEREPVIYFGCTWSEIVGQLRKSAFIAFLTAIVLSAGLAALSLPFQAVFPICTVVFIIITLLLTKIFLQGIAKLRSGKPLFYEKHATTGKTGRFIQPQYISYQRERNGTKAQK